MVALFYTLITIMASMTALIAIAFVYTIVITYRQSKTFINNLKVGDETNYGKVSYLDGDYVIISREPLRIHRSEIQPKDFKASKYLFIGRLKP